MTTHQTIRNTSLRVIGRGEINSNISNPPANKLLTQRNRRTIIFFVSFLISSMLFACWALMVIHVNSVPHPSDITNGMIITAHVVSLLVNVIFSFLCFIAITVQGITWFLWCMPMLALALHLLKHLCDRHRWPMFTSQKT